MSHNLKPVRSRAFERTVGLLTGAAIGALVIGCCVRCSTINTKIVDPLLSDLSKISATVKSDLLNAVAIANAATPPDTDGANCANAALTVQAQIAAVLAANNTANAGALSAAELASLFQPGSAQYDQAKQALTSGCAAKAQDVLGAAGVLAAGGVVGAIAGGQILPMLAPAL